jgi:hypothetical protein
VASSSTILARVTLCYTFGLSRDTLRKRLEATMGTRQSFEYFLPRTVVRFSGRRTETVDELAQGPVISLEAAVECVERADPEWPLRIALDGTFLRDREGSIGFTADRRLTSLSATTTGAAGRLASGAIRFVTSTVAATAAALPSFAGRVATNITPPSDPVEDQYATDCPQASVDRAEIRAAVVANRQAIVLAATGAAQAGNAVAMRRLVAASKVLTELQDKAAAHFAAWRESKKSVHTQDLAFEVPILALPGAEEVNAGLDALTEELLGDCWEPFDKLGVFAAVESDPREPTDSPAPGVTSPGFYFRSPRTVWLSIYERPAGATDVRLVERRRQLVYDASCATEYVSCDTGAWSKKSVSAELDAGSALSRITTSSQGGAGAAGDALAGAVDQVVKGLTDAETITRSLDTLRDRGVDRRIAELEKRRKLLAAQVAADADAADIATLREIARLDHEQELLTARKEVAALTEPPAMPGMRH